MILSIVFLSAYMVIKAIFLLLYLNTCHYFFTNLCNPYTRENADADFFIYPFEIILMSISITAMAWYFIATKWDRINYIISRLLIAAKFPFLSALKYFSSFPQNSRINGLSNSLFSYQATFYCFNILIYLLVTMKISYEDAAQAYIHGCAATLVFYSLYIFFSSGFSRLLVFFSTCYACYFSYLICDIAFSKFITYTEYKFPSHHEYYYFKSMESLLLLSIAATIFLISKKYKFAILLYNFSLILCSIVFSFYGFEYFAGVLEHTAVSAGVFIAISYFIVLLLFSAAIENISAYATLRMLNTASGKSGASFRRSLLLLAITLATFIASIFILYFFVKIWVVVLIFLSDGNLNKIHQLFSLDIDLILNMLTDRKKESLISALSTIESIKDFSNYFIEYHGEEKDDHIFEKSISFLYLVSPIVPAIFGIIATLSTVALRIFSTMIYRTALGIALESGKDIKFIKKLTAGLIVTLSGVIVALFTIFSTS